MTDNPMNAYLALVSKREVRQYTDQPIPDAALTRMLQAGRATGSAKNRQHWRFFVIRNQEMLARIAEHISAPANLDGCPAAIAVVMTTPHGFDAGRAAQNIALAAWADGIGTCPNTPTDKDACRTLLGLEAEWDIPTILSLGYPAEPVRPKDRDVDAILERINRKPLAELTHWID